MFMSSPSLSSIQHTKVEYNNHMNKVSSDETGNTNAVESDHKGETSKTDSVVDTIPNTAVEFEENSISQPHPSEMGYTGHVAAEQQSDEVFDNRCQAHSVWQPVDVSSSWDTSLGDTNQPLLYPDGYPLGHYSMYYDPNMQGYYQNEYYDQGYYQNEYYSQGYWQGMWAPWPQQIYQQTDVSSQASSSTELLGRQNRDSSQSNVSQSPRPSPSPSTRYFHQQRPQPPPEDITPNLKIVEEPGNDLSDTEKEEYQVFKEIFNNGESLETLSLEQKDVFEHVIYHYPRYAGIPEYVEYILGDYDGHNELRPRQKPSQIPTPADDLVQRAQQVKDKAKEFAAYYQSCEWDRTNGWDVYERVTLLDVESLKIGQPEPSPQLEIPQPTMYVVLFLQLPKEKIPAKSDDGSPVPCCEISGDLLETIVGKANCKTRCTQPTFVKHKWKGEFPLCGYKKDPHDRTRRVAKVFRGRQDVGAVYETIVRYVQRK